MWLNQKKKRLVFSGKKRENIHVGKTRESKYEKSQRFIANADEIWHGDLFGVKNIEKDDTGDDHL